MPEKTTSRPSCADCSNCRKKNQHLGYCEMAGIGWVKLRKGLVNCKKAKWFNKSPEEARAEMEERMAEIPEKLAGKAEIKPDVPLKPIKE